MKFAVKYFVEIIAMVVLLCGCKVQHKQVINTQPGDGRYDSEFPSSSISESLDKISESVKRLDCLAFYATYHFDPAEHIQRNQLTEALIRNKSTGKTISNESVSGTATIIYNLNNLVGMVTCAHVIDFPDTVFTYSDDSIKALIAVSFIVKQQMFVTGLPDGDAVKVVAMDKIKDIAFLSKRINSDNESVNVLNYPVGKTSLFEWGSVVYIVGYPLGNLMVTRALVSNPGRSKKGSFLTDALYNHGISGSPVFAIKDGVPNLEWVGMASATAASDLVVVKPEKDAEVLHTGNHPYRGNLFLEKVKLINYGVTYSISIEEIVIFIRKNQTLLKSLGFDFDMYFK
ncbi:MAG: serine protease [Bacteroidales bacterium]|jgi:S1-C subfamily serine protease